MPWFTFSFPDFSHAFLSVLVEGVPFLLLGSLISGLVDVFISSERISRLLPKNHVLGILVSGLLGLFLPMCECGSVIVIRRFIRKGLPLSHAVAYMLGAPIVGPLVALSTWAAFQGNRPWEMTSLRLSLGYLVAIGAAFIVHRLPADRILQPGLMPSAANRRGGLQISAAPTSETPDFADVAAGASFPRKLLLAAQSATADFLDVAFFFIIGVAITSVFNTAVNQQIIAPFATSPLISILVLMGIAAALALCSTTDAFVAASFIKFSPAAKLAFLVFGPVFDLKLFWLYGLIFRPRFVVLLALGLFVSIAFVCWRIAPFLSVAP
jgi:uncharacterized membrane protein YraQ (UPF0718 family)